MIKQFDCFNRRFLNFPAVCPCRDISPAILLRSLITLSRNICKYRFEFFAVHRKNSREIVRQIEILLVFSEEIEDRKADLSDTIVISLIELHVALQKILFLFEDCTQGARLNVLVNSHFITTQFQELIRLIVDSLDVISLREVDIPSEIRELVELLAKQARKAKFNTDPGDELALKNVILILSQFENKIEPGRSFIKQTLDYLEIKTWRDCHNEIKIIEDECLEGTNREITLMSSLLGFMCYCRGVIFETGDFGNSIQTRGRKSFESATWQNVEDFRCPISLELMTDPVTVSTGQTYDRSSIQKWLKSGNLICPTTGKKLANTNLLPNSTFRKLILQFCTDNGISLANKSRKKNRDITRTVLPNSPSSTESIRFLSEFLSDKLYFGLEVDRNKAAYEIRLLAKSNLFNRACLIEAGTVTPLLHLLNSIDSCTQENAIAALLKLSKHASGTKAIVENGGLKAIIHILQNGLKLESKQIAAATIFYLSSVSECRKLIGKSREAIPALVKLIKEGTNFGKKNAIVAIFGLLMHKSNHEKVLSSGIIPVLIDILNSPNEDELISDSLAVISTLSERKEGSIEISEASHFSIFINNLSSSNSRTAKEHCVSILLALCDNCGANKIAELAKEPCLINLLYSVLTDGTSRARKKTRSLIRVLHGYHETNLRSDVTHERYIHVR